MNAYRQAEIDRIRARTDIDDAHKEYLIRLVSMTREEMNAHMARRNTLMRSLSYSITLTGGELEQIAFAASLNRRMLDRGAEHQILDRAFAVIEEKCGKILQAEWNKVK